MTVLPPAPGVVPDRRVVLDLDDNTNLYGTPPAALRVIAAASHDGVTRYPSPFADQLRRALARYAGVGDDRISTGCGSDDVLDTTFRTFAEPGARIAFSDPTFSMIPVLARRNRLAPCPVPLTKGFDPDADALLATGAPIIYLCSPNNPTGTAASRASVTRVLDHAPGLDRAVDERDPDGMAASGDEDANPDAAREHVRLGMIIRADQDVAALTQLDAVAFARQLRAQHAADGARHGLFGRAGDYRHRDLDRIAAVDGGNAEFEVAARCSFAGGRDVPHAGRGWRGGRKSRSRHEGGEHGEAVGGLHVGLRAGAPRRIPGRTLGWPGVTRPRP